MKRTLRIKVAARYEFDGTPPVQNPESAAITSLAFKQCRFLPQPIKVVVEGNDAILQFPEDTCVLVD